MFRKELPGCSCSMLALGPGGTKLEFSLNLPQLTWNAWYHCPVA